MNQPQRIVVIEIRTMNNPDLDPSQIKSITVYEDSGGYYLASDLSQIRAYIIEAVKTIISLGDNYRHPLYFDVQVAPGDEMDYLLDSSSNRSKVRRKRKRR